MLSERHSLNLKLCFKQYNKMAGFLHLIVVPQLSSGWRHNHSAKTRHAGCANEQSMYSLMSMFSHQTSVEKGVTKIQLWHLQFWSHFVVLLKSDLDVEQISLL